MTNKSARTQRGEVGDALVERCLTGTPHANYTVFKTIRVLRSGLGDKVVQEILNSLGISEDLKTEGQPQRLRIRRPDEPWRLGEWGKQRHLQALIVARANELAEKPQEHGSQNEHSWAMAARAAYRESSTIPITEGVPIPHLPETGLERTPTREPAPATLPAPGGETEKPQTVKEKAESKPEEQRPRQETPYPATPSTWIRSVFFAARVLLIADLLIWLLGVSLAALQIGETIALAAFPSQEDHATPHDPPAPKTRDRKAAAEPIAKPILQKPDEKQVAVILPKRETLRVLSSCRKRSARENGVCAMVHGDTLSQIARIHRRNESSFRFGKRLARMNHIRVPEWGITEGDIDARRLLAGHVITLAVD